jgi:hypothetical protein
MLTQIEGGHFAAGQPTRYLPRSSDQLLPSDPVAVTMPSGRGQSAGLAHGDRQTVGRHERFRRPAPSMGGRAHLSWFGRNRRLAKDFENLAETLATFVTLASIQLAIRRLARA